MNITIELLIQLCSLIGGLVTVWLGLNTKITRLESAQEVFEKKMNGYQADNKQLQDELKELNKNMQTIMVELAKISTYIELTKERNDD